MAESPPVPPYGTVNPWEYAKPLLLALRHFDHMPFCPECGWGPEAHIHYHANEETLIEWACPKVHRNPMDRLGNVNLADEE